MESDKAPTVLVVDDEALVRMYAVDVFEEAGFEVLEARDAADALQVLERLDTEGRAIDLLFTDVNMPGAMDGMELARRVHDAHPDMAVLIASGKVQADDGALPQGTPFLPTPYTPEAVLRVACRCVAHRPR